MKNSIQERISYLLGYEINVMTIEKTDSGTFIRRLCSSFFLLALNLDDGSLSLTKSTRSKLNQIIITPHIYLYLQAFYPEELELLSSFIERTFHHHFVLSRRSDGNFYTLRIQKTEEAIRFLNEFTFYAYAIPSMRKKLDWDYQLQLEREKHSDMTVVSSKAKNDYTTDEIEFIIQSKQNGMTDATIA